MLRSASAGGTPPFPRVHHAPPASADIAGYRHSICAGYNFANQSLFIDIACLLWAFNIQKAKDPKTGEVITPDPDDFRDGGLVLCLSPPLLFSYTLFS